MKRLLSDELWELVEQLLPPEPDSYMRIYLAFPRKRGWVVRMI